MASPNATFTELVSTTFRKHGKTFIDNVSKNNAFLAYLMRNGQFRTIDGGLVNEPIPALRRRDLRAGAHGARYVLGGRSDRVDCSLRCGVRVQGRQVIDQVVLVLAVRVVLLLAALQGLVVGVEVLPSLASVDPRTDSANVLVVRRRDAAREGFREAVVREHASNRNHELHG